MKRQSKELYEKIARAGFAARGVTYGLIGLLAFMAAVGSGGSTTGSTGALERLSTSGWGMAILTFVGIGMIGYGVWRVTSAALDLENEGADKEGIAHRLAHAGSGVFHFGLGILAFSLVIGGSSGSGGGAASWTAALMGAPAGRWLVALAGLIGFVAAAAQLKKALREEYKERTRIPQSSRFIDPAIKAGIVSRGGVFAIIGGFLLYAAVTANPDNARGIGGALDWLQAQSYGGLLLAVISVGLILFAGFSFIQARYRVIPDPESKTAVG